MECVQLVFILVPHQHLFVEIYVELFSLIIHYLELLRKKKSRLGREVQKKVNPLTTGCVIKKDINENILKEIKPRIELLRKKKECAQRKLDMLCIHIHKICEYVNKTYVLPKKFNDRQREELLIWPPFLCFLWLWLWTNKH